MSTKADYDYDGVDYDAHCKQTPAAAYQPPVRQSLLLAMLRNPWGRLVLAAVTADWAWLSFADPTSNSFLMVFGVCSALAALWLVWLSRTVVMLAILGTIFLALALGSLYLLSRFTMAFPIPASILVGSGIIAGAIWLTRRVS
jgi:hypothetical protein